MIRKALVIGVNRYSNLINSQGQKMHLGYNQEDPQEAGGPAFDAEAISKILYEYGHFDITKIPCKQYPPEIDPQGKVYFDNVEKEIEKLFKPKNANIPDMALLFFAGHGLPGYLALGDTDGENQLGLSLSWLRGILKDSPVQQQIVWLDCCHSGDLINFSQEELREWKHLQGDRHLIVACPSGRDAYSIKGKHGILTETLLQALDPANSGDRQVSSWSIKRFIEEKIDQDPLLKKQFPLDEAFGKEIILWPGKREKKLDQDPLLKKQFPPDEAFNRQMIFWPSKRDEIRSGQQEPPKHRIILALLPDRNEYQPLLKALREVVEENWHCQLMTTKDRQYQDNILDNIRYHIEQAHAFIADISEADGEVMFMLGAVQFVSNYPSVLLITGQPKLTPILEGRLKITYNYNHSNLATYLDSELKRIEVIRQLLNDTTRHHYISKSKLQQIIGTRLSLGERNLTAIQEYYPTQEAWQTADVSMLQSLLGKEDADLAGIILKKVREVTL